VTRFRYPCGLTALCLAIFLGADGAVQSQTRSATGPTSLFGRPTDLPPLVSQAGNVDQGQAQTLPALSQVSTKSPEMQPSELGVALKVKARFLFRGRDAIVLLESGGQTLQVRTGSRFTIGNNMQMRVLEINSAEVRLEVEANNRIVVLH